MAMQPTPSPTSFGGEISDFAQGRFDKPDYRVSLNVCLNAFPVEIGAWTRRPGTAHAGHTRGGARAHHQVRLRAGQRGHAGIHRRLLRFRSGARCSPTTRRWWSRYPPPIRPWCRPPSAVTLGRPATRWCSPAPRRRCWRTASSIATKVDTTHFSLADALTGAGDRRRDAGRADRRRHRARVQELTTSMWKRQWSRHARGAGRDHRHPAAGHQRQLYACTPQCSTTAHTWTRSRMA
jgi:hypothetical protein